MQALSAPTGTEPATAWLDVSIVIPVFNEVECLTELHREITKVIESIPVSYEILFVDDGSNDGTMELLEALFQGDAHVRVICLRKRFGKTAALVAGFHEALGALVITMDGDLQDDPRRSPDS